MSNYVLVILFSMKHITFVVALLMVGVYAPATQAATDTPQSVEAAVREYFADIPVMIEIARCESKFRQFTDSGNVLRGGAGGQMIGVFQFFDRYHVSTANDLGYDIETLAGNLAYAKHVFSREGTTPWNSARECWNVPNLTLQPVSPVLEATTITETDELLRQKIALLQQVINLLQTLLAARQ